jgi:hypothetical protein
MDNKPDNKRLYVLLGVLALLAGWLAYDRSTEVIEVVQPRAGRPAVATSGGTAPSIGRPGPVGPVDSAELERVNPRARVKLGALRDTTQRPLFETDRRPVVVPVVMAPPVSAPVASPRVEPRVDFQLAGIVAGGANPTVLIKRAGGGSSLRVHKGDVIDGWTVDVISTDQVTVRRDGTKIVLRLFGKQ